MRPQFRAVPTIRIEIERVSDDDGEILADDNAGDIETIGDLPRGVVGGVVGPQFPACPVIGVEVQGVADGL